MRKIGKLSSLILCLLLVTMVFAVVAPANIGGEEPGGDPGFPEEPDYEGDPLEPPELPEEPEYPFEEEEEGWFVEGTGTYFEITNSEYLNIILTSSEIVYIYLESVPRMVSFNIEADCEATSTDITLSGFEGNMIYYRYQDGDLQEEFTTDETGSHSYTQDISTYHHVFIQEDTSTYTIRDDATGGDSTLIGTWDPITKTCTLTMDVNEPIVIEDDGITLDGAGYILQGSGSGNGVYINGLSYVKVLNLNIKDFTYGVHLYSSSYNNIVDNVLINNFYGLNIYQHSHNNVIINNAISNCRYAIQLYRSNGNEINNNPISWASSSSVWPYGISLSTLCSGNKIEYNTVTNSVTAKGHGITLNNVGSNTLKGNTISNFQYGIYSYAYGLTLTGNVMSGCGIYIHSYGIGHWDTHTIDTTNTVNGKPVYYFKNVIGGTLDTAAGQVILASSQDITIEYQDLSDSSVGLQMGYSSGNTIRGNLMSNNFFGIELDHSNDNIIQDNRVENLRRISGMEIHSSSRNLIENNVLTQGMIALRYDSDYNRLEYNTITQHYSMWGTGIYDLGSVGTSYLGNTITVQKIAISLNYVNDVTVNDNTLVTGPVSFFPHGPDIHGIRHLEGINTVITGNTMIRGGVYIQGYLLEHWNTHTIDDANMINDKPLIYWKDRVGGTVPSEAGEVILANCQGVLVENMYVTAGTIGVELGFSSGNTIRNNYIWWVSHTGILLYNSQQNEIVDNQAWGRWSGIYALSSSTGSVITGNKVMGWRSGIELGGSGDAIISGNDAFGSAVGMYVASSGNTDILGNTINGWGALHVYLSDAVEISGNSIWSGHMGICIRSSNGAAVMNNDVYGSNYALYLQYLNDGYVFGNTFEASPGSSNYGYGIYAEYSTANTFERNTIMNSKTGAGFISSYGNTIFHNNILDNQVQASDTNPMDNNWHNPELLEGNYWSDYLGVDDGSGVGKHAIAGDRIGDTDIAHPETGYDFYPFTEPDAWLNEPPVAHPGGPYTGYEGSEIPFDASGSSDPDGDPLLYRWDFDTDGTWDTGWSESPYAGNTWLDDHSGLVTVEVSDGSLTDTAFESVNVLNADPQIVEIISPIDPKSVGTPIDISAPFTDQGILDDHTAEINWGDGTITNGLIDEADGSGTVTGSHPYTIPGVYLITLTLWDKDGGEDTITTEYLVIYDPCGAFVTGGGIIDSPEGAYGPDPSITGKAGFGFVSKYKKGANEPDGNTQFRFHAADFRFQSTHYEWMVVSGPKAMFKGSGEINGEGDYGFILSAIDGEQPGGGGKDKFRIKIWEKDTNYVIYDNNRDMDEYGDPTTVLTHGSIKIHKG
ncbi:MAG: right-handed parallel beta-helix repeat-containing protein [Thermoplasmata archaeon]|nr:MAG: right-handed parallel beta-helix repeat-containing protein [Thermoplasmata archaeon]